MQSHIFTFFLHYIKALLLFHTISQPNYFSALYQNIGIVLYKITIWLCFCNTPKYHYSSMQNHNLTIFLHYTKILSLFYAKSRCKYFSTKYQNRVVFYAKSKSTYLSTWYQNIAIVLNKITIQLLFSRVPINRYILHKILF